MTGMITYKCKSITGGGEYEEVGSYNPHWAAEEFLKKREQDQMECSVGSGYAIDIVEVVDEEGVVRRFEVSGEPEFTYSAREVSSDG